MHAFLFAVIDKYLHGVYNLNTQWGYVKEEDYVGLL